MKIVNNYEISICLYKYLYYWSKKPDTIYIKAPTLFRLLRLQYTPLFRQYFDIYSIYLYLLQYLDENIDYQIFFQFFCLFTFSRISKLVKILLSVCKIHTNVAITYDQAVILFSSINPQYAEDSELTVYLNNVYKFA